MGRSNDLNMGGARETDRHLHMYGTKGGGMQGNGDLPASGRGEARHRSLQTWLFRRRRGDPGADRYGGRLALG